MRLSRILLNTIALAFTFSSLAIIYPYDSSLVEHYLKQSKYGEAISYLKEEIKKNPKEADSYFKLGEICRRQHNYNEAITWFKEVIQISPESSGGYIGLGRTYENMDKYDEAIKWYKEAIRINPKDSTAYEGLGAVYFEMSNYSESLKWHKEALRINPHNLYAYYGLGDTYRKQGNYKEAIKFFQEAIKINPDNSRGYDGLGFVYYNMSEYDEAIKWYKEAMRKDPSNTNVYYGLGLVYEALAKYDEAARLYKEAIRINPEDFGGYEGIARIYAKDGKYEDALRWYKDSVKRGSSSHILCPYEGLGLAYAKLGRSQETEETFLSMIKLKPYNSLGYYNLANYYYRTGKFTLAKQNIDKALSLIANPADKRQALRLKGFILIMQQDYVQAEKLFNDLVKEYGNDRVILVGLGHIANARKDYKLARRYFEQALGPGLSLKPEDKIIALLGLAWVNANEHKYKEAISCYQKILKEEPIVVFALVGMGDAYTQLGEYAKAEVYLKRAKAINPDFPGKPSKESLKKTETKL